MSEVNQPLLKLLYIGSDQTTVDLISSYPSFQVVVKSHALAAVSWLTETTFRLFELDEDSKSQVVYEEKHPIDAIICEFKLPGINGFTFFRRLKFMKIYQKVPFIILFPAYDKILKMEAFSMGIDDFYQVQIYPDRLYTRIQFLNIFKKEFQPKTHFLEDEEVTPYKIPVIKRIFDILIASFALLFLSPLMILVIIAIRLESRGKFYYQTS